MWILIINIIVVLLLLLSAGLVCFYVCNSNKQHVTHHLSFESSCFSIDLKYKKFYFYDSFFELNTNELPWFAFNDLLDIDAREKFKQITTSWLTKQMIDQTHAIIKFSTSDVYYNVTFQKLLPKENIVIGKISAYWNIHNQLLINHSMLKLTHINDNSDIFHFINTFHRTFFKHFLIIVYQFNINHVINTFLTPAQIDQFNQKILFFFKKNKIFWNKTTNHFTIICQNQVKLYFINLQINHFIKKLLFEEGIDVKNNVIFKACWVTRHHDVNSFLAQYEYLLAQHHRLLNNTNRLFNVFDNSTINHQNIINFQTIKNFFNEKTSLINQFDFVINNIFAITNLLNIKMFCILLNNINHVINVMNKVFDKQLVKQFLNYIIQKDDDWKKNYLIFLKHLFKVNDLFSKEQLVLLPLFLDHHNRFFITNILEVTDFINNQMASLFFKHDQLNVALLINSALLKTGSLANFNHLLSSIKSLACQSALLLNNDLIEKFFSFLCIIKNLDMVMLDVDVLADLLVNAFKRITLAKILTKLKAMKILVIANFNKSPHQSILAWLINYDVSFVNIINLDKKRSMLTT